MFEKLNLYWRWLRIKRVKARRYAAGDNFPVLVRTLVRVE